MRAIRGIHVDLDEAGASGTELEKDPFDTVGGPDAEAIAGLEAETAKTSGGEVHLGVEFAPGEPAILMARDQRKTVSKLEAAVLQQAQVFGSLAEALADCSLVVGAFARI